MHDGIAIIFIVAVVLAICFHPNNRSTDYHG